MRLTRVTRVVVGTVAADVAVATAVTVAALAALLTIPVQAQDKANGVEHRVTALEAAVTGLEANLALLQQQVTALQQQGPLLQQLLQRVVQLEALGPRVAALEQLGGRVSALEERTAFIHDTAVNCDAGQTISSALSRTTNHTGVVRITVSGACHENLDVMRGSTVLQAGSGASLTAANPALPVIRLVNRAFGASELTINGPFVISGGAVGVQADFGTVLHLRDARVSGNGTGITASNQAIVRLQNSHVEGGATGVWARSGARVFMNGGSLTDHDDFALLLETGAGADVNGFQITGNRGGGNGSTIRGAVGLYGGAVLRLANSTIAQNSGNGIFAVTGSAVWLDGNTIISGNGGHGVSLWDTSVLGKLFVTTTIQVTNNARAGISCSGAPGAAQLYGFPPAGQGVTTTGNTLGGVDCPVSPVH